MFEANPTELFWIFNRDHDGLERYLQIAADSIDKDGKSQTDVGPKHFGKGLENDLWSIEPVKQIEEQKYRIKNVREGVKACYLTVLGRAENNFHLGCYPYNSGEGKEDQYWLFQLGEDRRFRVKCNDGYYIDCSSNKGIKPGPEQEEVLIGCQQWKLKPYQLERKAGLRAAGQAEAPLLIPKFTGEIYSKNNPEYNLKIKQYASTSYPQDKMSPFLVLYPKTIDDVVFAVEYATCQHKKVVARSGGHQYSGKSSGGDDTILLSMDYFNKVNYLGDNVVKVQPCSQLKDVAKLFATLGITVPHGECPLVNIGGHTQTGGYGHLLRGFGLILDFVHDFDIVLADGSFRTVTRPKLDSNPTTAEEKLNQEIFRGVLSGNAGSYGIITQYTFHTLRDKDHPQSYGFAKNRRYEPEVFKKLLKVVQTWTQKIQSGQDAQLKGLDFMISIKTLQIPFVETGAPMMNIQCVYGDPDGGVKYNGQLKQIIDLANSKYQLGDWLIGKFLGNFDEKRSLSQCSKSFVRGWPEVTKDGREFKYPYKKRINATTKALTNEFIDAFVQKVNQVAFKQTKVHLIFQMGIGGGQTQIKGLQAINGLTVTGLPHRDILFNFVFDLFYEEGGQQIAIEIQKEMQIMLDKHYNHGKQNRLFWGSFENTNMVEKEVVDLYYDNEEQYTVLQALKAKIDPKDIFHTPFTVKLPGSTINKKC